MTFQSYFISSPNVTTYSSQLSGANKKVKTSLTALEKKKICQIKRSSPG